MSGTILTIMPIIFPVISGLLLFIFGNKITAKQRDFTVALALGINTVLTFLSFTGKGGELVLFYLNSSLSVGFSTDGVGMVYTGILAVMWLVVGVYSFEYIEGKGHGEEGGRELSPHIFYGFYLLVMGVMTGVGFSKDLVSFYMFYEFMTLLSVPLVIHTMTKEAVFAAKKYLFYSIGGASMALFGFAVIYAASKGNVGFVPGGIFEGQIPAGYETILPVAVFLAILGFGTKAGMFPMHGWLTSAHPVAPAPASAVLSGVIVKTGVLGIIRVVFYIAGADLVRGSWVQYAFLVISLITVFMGSMLAYYERIFKKRLAYSTVSQVSYILFGIATLNPVAFTGAMLHMVFHAVLKCGLFMNAGAVIHKTGVTTVDALRGIGKRMPKTFITFTIFSLGLIGIPPVCGFVSKWFLCVGALNEELGAFSYVGPAILMVSALLTAGYLFGIVIKAFFPGEDFKVSEEGEAVPADPGKGMLISMGFLAIAAVLMGIFPSAFVHFFETIAQGIF
ncbi:MAG: proton-conducting membrane transporter [Lachnospiraceae bacterium]|nr:proton-conducting membrane transporter [Lachnospiraceae bacterium]